jgi:hypothetical protein
MLPQLVLQLDRAGNITRQLGRVIDNLEANSHGGLAA